MRLSVVVVLANVVVLDSGVVAHVIVHESGIVAYILVLDSINAVVTFWLLSTNLFSLHWAYVCIGNVLTLTDYQFNIFQFQFPVQFRNWTGIEMISSNSV